MPNPRKCIVVIYRCRNVGGGKNIHTTEKCFKIGSTGHGRSAAAAYDMQNRGEATSTEVTLQTWSQAY